MGIIETSKPISILLVEDNIGDIRLTQEALKEGKILNKLFVARDGIEAMDFLNKTGKFADAVNPDIILLDLNLPKKDGREVLIELKNDPNHRRIPVIVLTTSKAEEDIIRSYELHANSYITKPVGLNEFIEVIKGITNYWFSIVKLPNIE